jgi:hypothetical protein
VLVLANLTLAPLLEEGTIDDYVFAFEELENNLHPSLQRRLFGFLRERAVSDQFMLFLSTHSNVVIDLFSTDPEAATFHVAGEDGRTTVQRVVTYVDRQGVLDDLDVRASDLLQANGIVWVEGPTDRLFFNRWVELATGGDIREGLHYQCVQYGGRLLSHLSAKDPEYDEDQLFRILRVNRNVILLGDSDKRGPRKHLNKTKSRMASEVKGAGGLAWFTQGREIENYLSADVIGRSLDLDDVRQVEQYESFADYLNDVMAGQGARYLKDKTAGAEAFAQNTTQDDLTGVLDLDAQIKQAVARIRAWNGLVEAVT